MLNINIENKKLEEKVEKRYKFQGKFNVKFVKPLKNKLIFIQKKKKH